MKLEGIFLPIFEDFQMFKIKRSLLEKKFLIVFI